MKKTLVLLFLSVSLFFNVSAFGETYSKNELAFDYPSGYKITPVKSPVMQMVLCESSDGNVYIAYTQMTNALFAMLDEKDMEETGIEALKEAGTRLNDKEKYRTFQMEDPRKVAMLHISGVQSDISIETTDGMQLQGLLFFTVKGQHTLLITVIYEQSVKTDDINAIVRSTRLGPEVMTVEASEDDSVFSVVEQKPQFPGGENALFRFLGENIIYPAIAMANNIQGRVICQFIVEKDGSISNIEIVRSGGDKSLDTEALRVLKTMPKWEPGVQNGKRVRVRYTIPVIFKLQDENHPKQEPQSN